MKPLYLSLLLAGLAAAPALAEFRLSVESWGDIPLCTSGQPNTVESPAFTLEDIPEGTDRIGFVLVDLDAPRYNHGGGFVAVSGGGSGTLPAGRFLYQSPCPPGETHLYEWRAIALNGEGVLGFASASLQYPQ